MMRSPASEVPALKHEGGHVLRAIVLIAMGTAALTLSAYAQIPLWPVKLSMQSFVVFILGFLYGPSLAVVTVAVYICAGAIGLPVFQSGAGPSYLLGPTGGFLVGFLGAAYVTGFATEKWGALSRPIVAAGSALLATIVVFVPGLVWLAVLFGAQKAMALGLSPFLPGAVLKLALATASIPLIRAARSKITK
ncbi:MAG: biotin transporter BioY [Hyphomicrobiales bacterium]|nr:biotin transporter BioY [Hyphomicrobiales bacterium]